MYPAVGDDYELTQNSIFLSTTPAFVNVTLLRDGVAGEPTETIILTLIHNTLLPPTDNQILLFSTVIINVQDNARTYICVCTFMYIMCAVIKPVHI